MPTRIPHNTARVFYSNEGATRTSPNGDVIRCAGRQQRSVTFYKAKKFLDDLDVPGDIYVWSEHTQQTTCCAKRRADGTWVGLDWLTGEWMPLS